MRILLRVTILLLAALVLSGAQSYSACGAPVIRTPGQQVLCCCATWGGGQCCAYIAMCTGNFIPGCVCR